MHLSCWTPATAVNYPASAVNLIHVFFLVHKVPYNIPGSLHEDHVPYNIPGSLQEDHVPYNISGSLQDVYPVVTTEKTDIPTKNDIRNFDTRPLTQQKATQAKIRLKIISQRVHFKAVVVGKFSWNGEQTYRDKKPFIIFIQDSAAWRTQPLELLSRHARRKEGNLVHLNASCLVLLGYPTDLAIIVISSAKKPEEHRSPMAESYFVSVGKQMASLVRPRNDTSLEKVGHTKVVTLMKKTEEGQWSPMPDTGLASVKSRTSSVVTSRNDTSSVEYVSQTELSDDYQGSGTATGRKLQLVVLNAVWGHWTAWGSCSSGCGKSGFSVRTRRCETRQNVPCDGMSFDMKECHPGIKCEAKFNDWGTWGPCSVTCGRGVRARSRVCVTEQQGLKCSGMSSLLERCTRPKCIQHVEDAPEPPPAVGASPTFPAFMKGQRLVAQKYYMFPARLVRRGDLSGNTSLEQSVPWGYEPPLQAGRESLTKLEKYLKIKIPWPPLRPPPNYERKRTSPVDPYIWAAWGRWSVCSSRCGDGQRLRKRLCIDHSQEADVKVMVKWCGQGGVTEMIHCLGPCSPVQAVEEEETLPTRVRIIESEGRGGPRVRTHHEFVEDIQIGRAEVVETGSRHGPKVEFSPDNDRSGPLSRAEIEETGGKGGPVVRTEHEFELNDNYVSFLATAENTTGGAEILLEIGDLRVSAETIVFIFLFLVCIVLLITSFCIYFLQRTIDANTKKQMRYAQPSYKPDDGRDSDTDEDLSVGGVVKPVLLPGRSLYGAAFMHGALQAQAARRKRKLRKFQLKPVRRVAGWRPFHTRGNRITETAPEQRRGPGERTSSDLG